MALEPKFIELFIVEQAELRRQPTERPDKPELHGDVVNGVVGPRFLRKLKASLEVPRPGHDGVCKVHIGPGSETLQAASFHQFVGKPTELKSSLVVAETRSGDHPEHDIGDARTVAVAVLEAEIDCLADGQ